MLSQNSVSYMKTVCQQGRHLMSSVVFDKEHLLCVQKVEVSKSIECIGKDSYMVIRLPSPIQ